MDSVHPGGLGGTYGANPVACAAAHAVLDIFEEENLLEKSVKIGDKLTRTFSAWKGEFNIVGEIRGIGAMRGLRRQPGGGTGRSAVKILLRQRPGHPGLRRTP